MTRVLQIICSDTGRVFVWLKIAGNLIRIIIIFQTLDFFIVSSLCKKIAAELDSCQCLNENMALGGTMSKSRTQSQESCCFNKKCSMEMEIDLRDWELPYFPSKTVLNNKNSKTTKVIIRESSSNIIKSELVLRLTKTFLTRGKSLKKLLFETVYSSTLPIL